MRVYLRWNKLLGVSAEDNDNDGRWVAVTESEELYPTQFSDSYLVILGFLAFYSLGPSHLPLRPALSARD